MAYKRNLQSETFCERHHFCWNHTVVSRHEDYTRCKCLGHAVDGKVLEERDCIEYADCTTAMVRNQSDAMFAAMKNHIKELDLEPDANQVVLKFGLTQGQYYTATSKDRIALLGWLLNFYWTYSGDGMCGIEVFKRADRVPLRSKEKLVVWEHEKGIMVGVRKYGAVAVSYTHMTLPTIYSV